MDKKTCTVREISGPLLTKARNAPQTYAYSLRNQLVSHNSGLQYSYDAFGRRVRSRKGGALPIRTVKHYLLPDGRPYLDRPTGPTPTPPAWSYAYLGDRMLARFDGAGNVEHVVTDHIGYPMATISYTGAVQWQTDPEPFGDVYAEQQMGPGHDPLIRYPGQWRVDPVLATTEPAFTTLYYNTYRWYNPTWGRYTQSDPILTEESHRFSPISAFGYAAARPLVLIDPLGLDDRWYAPGMLHNGWHGGAVCTVADDRCVLVNWWSSPFLDIDWVLSPKDCQWWKLGVGATHVERDGGLLFSFLSRISGGARPVLPEERESVEKPCSGECKCGYCRSATSGGPV